ncbi:nucleotidyl transferase AbiEii/AbiGii toxin family protein [Novosphingobium kaempferiae]|uniref:nucleotidyl transferase AbiEii/AbiGii toxin family protein n=1 Tax=Novosphingobium kaempferiae TaxID=2896849 RepID=UPI001E5AC09D|nr:nucleotidyl transferase AbiEii/AbiGii toxin family protein [Novosphingobium kaempferiae]
MAEPKSASAASIKQRLLNIARRSERPYDVVLVRYALERLLYRLSISAERDRFVLKGGMLVTLWIEGGHRETRDADFLGHGEAGSEHVRRVFEGIMSIDVNDGLTFDTANIRVGPIRDESEYSGIRLRTTAHLERTRIPVTIDIGFGDALSSEAERLDYPTLLDMGVPRIRTYPPAAVLAEKFQAIVALGIINGRMKDYFDLWAVPQTRLIDDEELDAAVKATFLRRRTPVPDKRPPGLSEPFAIDPAKEAQWQAYARSVQLVGLSLQAVTDEIWKVFGPTCARVAAGSRKDSPKNTP